MGHLDKLKKLRGKHVASVTVTTKVVCESQADWDTFLDYAATLPNVGTVTQDAGTRTYTVAQDAGGWDVTATEMTPR
jgi:hypothetical protein